MTETHRNAAAKRVAAYAAFKYRPYRSRPASRPNVETWVQLDLGSSKDMDRIELYPAFRAWSAPGEGFPVRFVIEASDEADFHNRIVLIDRRDRDFDDPGDQIVGFDLNGVKCRYVRFTATKLAPPRYSQLLRHFSEAARRSLTAPLLDQFVLSLGRIELISSGTNVALRSQITVDPEFGAPEHAGQLSRAARPNGEGVITDNPRNATAPSSWRRIENRASAPTSDVELHEGVFSKAHDDVVSYLMNSFSADDLLRQFRQRAGHSTCGSQPKSTPNSTFWEDDLAGSNAGRFLMGAGNALRWKPNEALRQRMLEVVEGVAACRQSNGYIMAYPEEAFFAGEKGAYSRAWLTHGLIEAGHAGAQLAFDLLRSHYDWFNSDARLPQALRRCGFGPQGTVANTRLYFTPVGKPEDIQVAQRFLQENYWLVQLAEGDADGIWQYPYDRPHCYLITFLEAYLDLYRATGQQPYLDAVLGAWRLFRNNWQYIGGAFSIIEWEETAPKSNPLYGRRGETCGSAFWILLNQRLHLLDPECERYITEIEKSIYNVILANQANNEGIRYHAILVGRKEAPRASNTCCEGQGARILASLAEFIYSVTTDGVYVNLFEPSSITLQIEGYSLTLSLRTLFPRSDLVQLAIVTKRPTKACIRIRAPSWLAGAMDVFVNGKCEGSGSPGSYLALQRVWRNGDTIEFRAEMPFKLTLYEGVDNIEGRERFALECGPILMAALDSAETQIIVRGAQAPAEILRRLQPVEGQPLRFAACDVIWAPYFELGSEHFSCFPFIDARETLY